MNGHCGDQHQRADAVRNIYKIKLRQINDKCSLEEKEIHSKLHHIITQAVRNIN
jgi:hypothetical protein